MYRIVYGTCKKCKQKFPNTEWHEKLNPETDNHQQPCPGCGELHSINEITITTELKDD